MSSEAPAPDLPEPSATRHKAFPIGYVTSCATLLILGGGYETKARLRHARLFDWLRILVVMPQPDQEIHDIVIGDSRMELCERSVCEEDVAQAHMVIEDTGDRVLAERVAAWCRRYRVPLNAVDKTDYCDLYYLSLVFRGPLVVGITSSGDAPALSAQLRRKLEADIGPGWGTAATLLAELRRRLPSGHTRMDVLRKLARDEKMLACIERNDEAGIRALIDHATAVLRTGNTESP